MSLHTLKKISSSYFAVKKQMRIELAPTRLYDRILNSGFMSLSQLAQSIVIKILGVNIELVTKMIHEEMNEKNN